MKIPFNRPYLTGKESFYISEAHARLQLAGDGYLTSKCSEWLERLTGSRRALLTNSCTAALEMSAILANIQPGDEIIMPSFTFVSTANAFVLRGGVPVFVDIHPDTFNMDESLLESAITRKTKAIVPVHYAGVACNMDVVMGIARAHNLLVIEDAAQGLLSTYKGRMLGSIGDFGCFSFHETKNIISGEGGALIINDSRFIERAEIIREKGTNRSQYFRGQVDKYTWMDVGSSYLPGEIIAAFLWAQAQEAVTITARRMQVWEKYHLAFLSLEASGRVGVPKVPADCLHNAHIYSLTLRDLADRTRFIAYMAEHGIGCVFHYVPLHCSPYGSRVGKVSGSLICTEEISDRLVRLPLWVGMANDEIEYVINKAYEYLIRS